MSEPTYADLLKFQELQARAQELSDPENQELERLKQLGINQELLRVLTLLHGGEQGLRKRKDQILGTDYVSEMFLYLTNKDVAIEDRIIRMQKVIEYSILQQVKEGLRFEQTFINIILKRISEEIERNREIVELKGRQGIRKVGQVDPDFVLREYQNWLAFFELMYVSIARLDARRDGMHQPLALLFQSINVYLRASRDNPLVTIERCKDLSANERERYDFVKSMLADKDEDQEKCNTDEIKSKAKQLFEQAKEEGHVLIIQPPSGSDPTYVYRLFNLLNRMSANEFEKSLVNGESVVYVSITELPGFHTLITLDSAKPNVAPTRTLGMFELKGQVTDPRNITIEEYRSKILQINHKGRIHRTELANALKLTYPHEVGSLDDIEYWKNLSQRGTKSIGQRIVFDTSRSEAKGILKDTIGLYQVEFKTDYSSRTLVVTCRFNYGNFEFVLDAFTFEPDLTRDYPDGMIWLLRQIYVILANIRQRDITEADLVEESEEGSASKGRKSSAETKSLRPNYILTALGERSLPLENFTRLFDREIRSIEDEKVQGVLIGGKFREEVIEAIYDVDKRKKILSKRFEEFDTSQNQQIYDFLNRIFAELNAGIVFGTPELRERTEIDFGVSLGIIDTAFFGMRTYELYKDDPMARVEYIENIEVYIDTILALSGEADRYRDPDKRRLLIAKLKGSKEGVGILVDLHTRLLKNEFERVGLRTTIGLAHAYHFLRIDNVESFTAKSSELMKVDNLRNYDNRARFLRKYNYLLVDQVQKLTTPEEFISLRANNRNLLSIRIALSEPPFGFRVSNDQLLIRFILIIFGVDPTKLDNNPNELNTQLEMLGRIRIGTNDEDFEVTRLLMRGISYNRGTDRTLRVYMPDAMEDMVKDATKQSV